MRSVDSDKENTAKERASKSVQDPGVFSFRFQVSLLVLTLVRVQVLPIVL